jgi:RecA-family ATPase
MSMLKAGNIENFKHLSVFTSLKDFNNNIEMFLAEHKADFTKSELVAFKRLVRFAARVKGVCNAKIQTILKAINDAAGGYGISRSTFERMIRKAKKLGILIVHNTERSSGGKGHNVFVFQRFTVDVSKPEKLTHCENVEKPTETSVDEAQAQTETINLSETNIQENKNNINHLNVNQPKRKPYLKGLPKRLQHFQDIFGKQVKSMYWRVWLAAKTLNVNVLTEDLQQIAHELFEQLKRALAEGRRFNTEQLHKYVYVSAREQIKERLESGEIEDLNRPHKLMYALVEETPNYEFSLDDVRSIFGF